MVGARYCVYRKEGGGIAFMYWVVVGRGGLLMEGHYLHCVGDTCEVLGCYYSFSPDSRIKPGADLSYEVRGCNEMGKSQNM